MSWESCESGCARGCGQMTPLALTVVAALVAALVWWLYEGRMTVKQAVAAVLRVARWQRYLTKHAGKAPGERPVFNE